MDFTQIKIAWITQKSRHW